MSKFSSILSAAGTTDTGALYPMTGEKGSFQVSGWGTGTMQIQVTNATSGSSLWNASGLQFTGNGVGTISGPFRGVRAVMTSVTSTSVTFLCNAVL